MAALVIAGNFYPAICNHRVERIPVNAEYLARAGDAYEFLAGHFPNFPELTNFAYLHPIAPMLQGKSGFRKKGKFVSIGEKLGPCKISVMTWQDVDENTVDFVPSQIGIQMGWEAKIIRVDDRDAVFADGLITGMEDEPAMTAVLSAAREKRPLPVRMDIDGKVIFADFLVEVFDGDGAIAARNDHVREFHVKLMTDGGFAIIVNDEVGK